MFTNSRKGIPSLVDRIGCRPYAIGLRFTVDKQGPLYFGPQFGLCARRAEQDFELGVTANDCVTHQDLRAQASGLKSTRPQEVLIDRTIDALVDLARHLLESDLEVGDCHFEVRLPTSADVATQRNCLRGRTTTTERRCQGL
jgi:hypothetical protein